MKRMSPVLILLIAAMNGCGSEAKFEVRVETESENANSVNTSSFEVKVADTNALRRQGLSGVKDLPKDEGMLFVMGKPTHMKMWMKDCYIPLDVLYFDAEKKLINYHSMTVPTKGLSDAALARYPSDKPAKYALELAGGMAEQLGVNPATTRIFFSKTLLKRVAEGAE